MGLFYFVEGTRRLYMSYMNFWIPCSFIWELFTISASSLRCLEFFFEKSSLHPWILIICVNHVNVLHCHHYLDHKHWKSLVCSNIFEWFIPMTSMLPISAKQRYCFEKMNERYINKDRETFFFFLLLLKLQCVVYTNSFFWIIDYFLSLSTN